MTRSQRDGEPLWSVMIPTHGSAPFLEQTLRSVMEQDPGPAAMQIEVVDDASPVPAAEQLVRSVGAGRVTFFRQAGNVGITRNFATCVERARGRLVHILHDDDLVRPGFYDALARPFGTSSSLGAAFCRHLIIDETGSWQTLGPPLSGTAGPLPDALRLFAVKQRVQMAGMVVRRDVYDAVGPFAHDLQHTADWEMWARIAARFGIWYEPNPLALYRVHSRSDTSALIRSGENVREIRRAIQRIVGMMPAQDRRPVRREALAAAARQALVSAAELRLVHGDLSGSLRQILEAVRCSGRPSVLAAAARSVVGVMRGSLRRPVLVTKRGRAPDGHSQGEGDLD